MNVLLWYWGKRGGGAKYTLELAKALQSTAEVNLFLSLSKQNELYSEFADIPVLQCNINTFRSGFGAIFNTIHFISYRQQIKHFLRQNKIDKVVFTMMHIWDVFFIRILKQLSIPYCIVMHDALAHLGEQSLVRNYLESKILRNADTIVTLTEAVKEQLLIRFNKLKLKIMVIPHGILDYSSSTKNLVRKPHQPMRLLFFGRIVEYKGLDLLLRACQILQDKAIEFRLCIAGEGNLKPYHEVINKISKHVEILNGWIADDEIREIFENNDVLVLPYKEASQSGVAAIAFSCAMPIIATKVGGLSEQLSASKGVKFADGVNADAIAEAITSFIDHPSEYEQYSTNLIEYKKTAETSWIYIAQNLIKMLQN